MAGVLLVLGGVFLALSADAAGKPSEKNVLKLPQGKPGASAPAAKTPPPPQAAPRIPVVPQTVPAFVPPGPPPVDDTGLSAPVAAVLKAAQTLSAEEDSARWVDAGRCWVWVGMKRDKPWPKYRFTYDGECKQGRADGQGTLSIESQDAEGKWSLLAGIGPSWLSGFPLGDVKEGTGARLIVGLADRTVLSWMGPSLNEETEVFSVGRPDDQGRVVPCKSQGVLAVAQSGDIGGDRFKLLLRRSVSVVNGQCPGQTRTLWQTTLAATDNLALVIRQGMAAVEPTRAQAEVRDGILYDYSQRFQTQPTLLPTAQPVPGAPALLWTSPSDEIDPQLALVFAVPAGLLLLLLGAVRFAYAQSRDAAANARKTPLKKPANNAGRR
jgi:hypothetical protein